MKRYVRPKSFCRPREQVHHLRLDRDVQGRHRLVEHDQRRVQRQRARDADPLPLAAGELVRKPVGVLRAEPDGPQQLLDAQASVLAAVQAVDAQRLGDDLAHGHPRVQRGVGVLEDDLDLAADGTHLLAAVVRDVLAVEDDPTRGRLEQLHDRAAERRLAATRLPDDSERLAPKNREIDAVHRLHLADGVLEEAGLDREVLDEPFDAKKLVLGRRPPVCSGFVNGASLTTAHPTVASGRLRGRELLGEVARRDMLLAIAERAERRDLGPAERPPLRQLAARVERASRRRRDQARRLARNRVEPFLVDVEPREAVHEPERVRMPGRVEDRVDVAELHHPARVHHDDPVRELGDQAEVVGDQDDRRVRLRAAPP